MMLSFRVKSGDDVWFGKAGESLDKYQQVIIRDGTDDSMTVVTPTEVLEVPFDGAMVELGLLGVQVTAKQDEDTPGGGRIPGQMMFGMIAADDVLILRGRTYRSNLDV